MISLYDKKGRSLGIRCRTVGEAVTAMRQVQRAELARDEHDLVVAQRYHRPIAAQIRRALELGAEPGQLALFDDGNPSPLPRLVRRSGARKVAP